jgi:hypothetical protein
MMEAIRASETSVVFCQFVPEKRGPLPIELGGNEFLSMFQLTVLLLCAVTLCRLVDRYQRFRETVVSIFKAEDGDGMFFEKLLSTYESPHGPEQHRESYRTENVTSRIYFS